jgi:hypothetical protein
MLQSGYQEMRVRKTLYVICCAAGIVVAVCGLGVGEARQSSSPAPIAGGLVSIEAVPVPLNPANPSETAVGDFSYAGGLVLTSSQTDQLHGLSDIDITNTDQLIAVGDLGVFFEARLDLDEAGRLVGLTDARLTPLTGQDGEPLTDKADADAEGLAVLQNGDRLVSFERRHRIWLYPSAGGLSRVAPMPDTSFPLNGGMEALAADPEAGADAFVVGAEVSGETWTCRVLQMQCIKGPTVDKPEEFGLVAIKRLPGGQTAYLLRAYDAERGNRISLQIFRSGSLAARMDLARPMTVDNYEGLAAVPGDDGGVRFYLLSDDNGLPPQRTILLAFDWRPR